MLVQVRPGKASSPLDRLVAPLTEAEFLAALCERRVTHLRAANDHYAAWLGWEALRRLIERGEYSQEHDHLWVSKESVAVPQRNWETNGKVDVAKLEDFLAKGFSLILTHIEPYVPPLAALCDQIKSQLSEASYAGVIVTSSTDGAFKLHFDFEDSSSFRHSHIFTRSGGCGSLAIWSAYHACSIPDRSTGYDSGTCPLMASRIDAKNDERVRAISKRGIRSSCRESFSTVSPICLKAASIRCKR